MRGAILATAAAFAGQAVADVHMRRHAHEGLHHRAFPATSPAVHSSSAVAEEECGCTTEVISYYGEPTTIPLSVPTSTVTSETTSTVESTSYSTVTVTATSSAPPAESPVETPSEAPVETPSEAPVETPSEAPVETPSETPAPTPEVTLPTPGLSTYTEPGTYTVPATTLTVSETTTVCGATSTELPSGTHTYGGVTTVVETATTVTCPYATVKPSGSTVTSVIETTTYVCPSAGTYTIAPTTTTVPDNTVVVYPTPATYTPGTYTNPGSTITVTNTDYTYVCPFTDGNEPTSAPATNTAVPTTTAPAQTTTAAASTTSSTATSVPTGASGNHMGMTFTLFHDDESCMSKSEVLDKIGALKEKGFSHVRVYDTQCGTLEKVGEACKTHGMKMILGVFTDGTEKQQVEEIAKWAQWDVVSLIVAENEAITGGSFQPAEVVGMIKKWKSTWEAAGYTGKVTIAEPIDVWLKYGDTLCPAVDILGANLHPFFNAEFSAAEAGELVGNQIRDLKQVCSGKDVINLETGWPNNGNANGKAIPSRSEQSTAIKALEKAVGDVSVFFSYTDDLWKLKQKGASGSAGNEFNVETHWGCFDQF
ncbi:putative cell wall glucanase (Scw11) [Aspergillus puulaauensis]|uniref:Probable beta-glucosidase btgE n=1 Tax=Aspergillus puulaauensis TaxID=1220207 RepID=A0A7R8AK25_9EURO|nr:uncharacterized protein APUU_21654S [Aspergillus puulaauensis]BCS21222.1 hypothetical protein APUU_21654S [Aspergillus puulaauensis]